MKSLIGFFFLIAFSITSYSQKSEIYAPNGKAIKGYDPVAFFKESQPVMGLDSLTYRWKDADWYFSTSENLQNFKSMPEAYAPQYGGYCAYGTSKGHKAPTMVETWTIVDNKLYFNYDAKVKVAWTKNRDKLIELADREWMLIKDKE